MPKLHKAFGFNKDKVEQGIWFEPISGLRLRIARMPNPRLEAHMLRSKQNQQALRFGANPEILKKITMDAVAHCVLLGWEGLTDGEPEVLVEFSPEEAVNQFTQYPDFYRAVLEIAQDKSLFQDEEDVGNLSNA